MEERGRWLASGLFGHHLRTAGVVRLQAKVADRHFFLLWPGLVLTLACRPGCVPIPVRLAAAMAGPVKGVGQHAGRPVRGAGVASAPRIRANATGLTDGRCRSSIEWDIVARSGNRMAPFRDDAGCRRKT